MTYAQRRDALTLALKSLFDHVGGRRPPDVAFENVIDLLMPAPDPVAVCESCHTAPPKPDMGAYYELVAENAALKAKLFDIIHDAQRVAAIVNGAQHALSMTPRRDAVERVLNLDPTPYMPPEVTESFCDCTDERACKVCIDKTLPL